MSGAVAPRPAPPAVLLLVTLAAIQPFALNVVAPATPSLARSLGADFGAIALTLSLYLYSVALTQLVGGPLSDRYGRRPVMLAGVLIFIAGSLIAVFAETVKMLYAARMLQGVGAGWAFTLVRAIIRDTSIGNEAASRIGYVMTLMVVVPMLSPGLGGVIDTRLGWRAIFWVMAGLGTVAFVLAFALLKETHLARNPSASIGQMFSGFPILMREPLYLTTVGALLSTGMIFFSFIGASPYIVVEYMGRSADVYGIWFVAMSGGYMLGNFLIGRFVNRYGVERMMSLGVTFTLVGAIVLLATLLTFGWSPATLFLPMFLSSLGNGMTMPSATAASLSIRPDLAGSAAGLGAAIQLGFGATASSLTSYGVTFTPWALVVTVVVAAAIGFLADLRLRRLRRRGAAPTAESA